jgi:hypothetical protein
MRRQDLISTEELREIEAREGPIYAAFEIYDRWLTRHAIEHPEDERDMVDLATVFAAEMEEEANDASA